MAWIKIPKEHHPIFEAALPSDPRIEVKSMFGGLAAMLNGQMMAGLFAQSAIVKLGPSDYAALEKKGGEPFDPMGNGRTMASTLVMPESEFRDRTRLAAWILRARDYVASLPAKKKTTKPKPATKAKASAAPAKKKAAAKRSS